MRFTLKTLIVILVLVGGLAALYSRVIRRSDRYYRGYFQAQRLQTLISGIDPAVKVQGSGGGGGGSVHFMTHYTHYLNSERPIGEELLHKVRRQLTQDLQSQSIKILEDKNANGGDSHYPSTGYRLTRWGFQILFEEKGHKGVIVIQLMSKAVPGTESMGHTAELIENIVVFPRD